MTDSMFEGREQVDEEDYDLLTYTEAGTRLDQEIALQRRRLAEMGEDAPERAECEQRIAALEAARDRHNSRAITDENVQNFFGYDTRSR